MKLLVLQRHQQRRRRCYALSRGGELKAPNDDDAVAAGYSPEERNWAALRAGRGPASFCLAKATAALAFGPEW